MKYKTKKRIQGSITVLMVVILLPMMTLSALVVDTSRINMARSMVSSAGDLAMNSALANYDTILKDVYGLFAMSQEPAAEGEKTQEEKIKEYFQKTLVSYGATNVADAGDYVGQLLGTVEGLWKENGDSNVTSLLNMTIQDDLKVTKVSNSSLANADILRAGIVEYMKYRAPLNFGMSFLDSIKSFTLIEDQTVVVEKQVAAQQSTQGVTGACSAAITAIREYDDLIESIQNGEKKVTGVNTFDDEGVVTMEAYDTQVNKYGTNWGSKYNNINKLNLTFLLKVPTLTNRYLVNKGTSSFITKDANNVYGISEANSGISVTVTDATDTAGAKSAFDAQFNVLNADGSTYLTAANNYVNANYVPTTNYNSEDFKSFTLEWTAVSDSFTAYEKFLLDKSDASVTYTSFKTILEEIVKLKKYYDKYISLVNADIQAQQTIYDEANGKIEDAEDAKTNGSTYISQDKTFITNNLSAINSENQTYTTNNSSNDEATKAKYDYSFLNNSDYGFSSSEFRNVINQTYSTTSYTSKTNIYKNLYKKLIVTKNVNNTIHKDIINILKNYFSSPSSSISGFTTFENKLKSYNTDPLYFVACLLYKNAVRIERVNKYVGDIATEETNIENADDIIETQTPIRDNAKAAKENLENEKNGVVGNYQAALGAYKNSTDRYQTDMVSYANHITVAKNIVTENATEINTQYNAILTNMKSVHDKLDDIYKKLEAVKTAIEIYQGKVKEWQTANDNYANENKSDTFSSQNQSDIDATKNEYDLNKLSSLMTYVSNYKGKIDVFYNYINSADNFKYGSKNIKDIKTATDTIAAADGVKANLGDIVTLTDAGNQFNNLYVNVSAPEIDWDSDKFLFLGTPIVNEPFLIYLNETYPESEKVETSETTQEGETKEEDPNVTNYNSTKDKLKSDSGKKTTDVGTGEAENNVFGYTYKSITKEQMSGLPSGSDSNKGAQEQLKVGEDENGDVDAASGVSQQKSLLSSVLGEITSVATNTLENAYILTYIFENFSYATMVQDMIVEGENISNDQNLAKVAEIGPLVKKHAGDYKDKASTLSNYTIGSKNNFLNGAEIEYIIYGSRTPKNNTLYAKSCIYGIRFAFNCIYAFTNSEIRNMTRAAGLAVQAATMGFVPYQLVQIVLQLALAAAESALDLQLIGNGVDIAIVKTKETWMLSLTGAKNALEAMPEIVADAAATKYAEVVEKVSSGIQGVVDSSVDKLSANITSLSEDLLDAVESKADDIVDQAFTYATSSIENAINKIQYIDYEDVDAAKNEVIECFNEVRGKIEHIGDIFSEDNKIVDLVIPEIIGYINAEIQKIQDEVLAVIDENITTKEEIASAIVSKVNGWKQEILNYFKTTKETVRSSVNNAVSGVTADVKKELDSYIKQIGKDLTEDGAKVIKDGVSKATNSFINEKLNTENGKSTMGSTEASGTETSGKSVASMLKFGYKEYLMLFAFIQISANDREMLARIADIIQLNLQKSGSDFAHGQGSNFKMANAYTYVNVSGSVKLDMLFLNMDFFAQVFTDDETGDTEVEADLAPGATIKYNGLLGY